VDRVVHLARVRARHQVSGPHSFRKRRRPAANVNPMSRSGRCGQVAALRRPRGCPRCGVLARVPYAVRCRGAGPRALRGPLPGCDGLPDPSRQAGPMPRWIPGSTPDFPGGFPDPSHRGRRAECDGLPDPSRRTTRGEVLGCDGFPDPSRRAKWGRGAGVRWVPGSIALTGARAPPATGIAARFPPLVRATMR